MAEVFEGVALGAGGFRRRVAIKRMLRERSFDAAFGRMFLDEARIASQLHHANIVGVLDYGVSEGLPFQVLDYVEGMDAGRLRERGAAMGAPLPVEVALYVVTQIAHALAYAHAAVDGDGQPLGIIHRDVSPGNILVSWSGDVKLTDFGIAFAKGRLETTIAGTTKGTLLYMSPEQIMRGELDARTDVFALGCVLHALLTGSSPLAGDSAMAELVAGKPLAIDRGLPDDVYDIIGKATRRSRSDRFDGAAPLAEVLGEALARRISRDGRTITREWLAKVRGEAAPRRGKLDAFLDLEMVLASEGEAGREFAVRQVEPGTDADVLPPPRPLWPKVAAVVGVAASAGLALALWLAPGKPVVVAAVDAAPLPIPVVAAVIDAAPVAVVVMDAAPAPVDATPVRVTGRVRPPRPPPPQTREGITEGWLTISGEGALRAEIHIDGQMKGYAPQRIPVSVGTHGVKLVLPDGSVREKRIEIRPTHTPSAPAEWKVP